MILPTFRKKMLLPSSVYKWLGWKYHQVM